MADPLGGGGTGAEAVAQLEAPPKDEDENPVLNFPRGILSIGTPILDKIILLHLMSSLPEVRVVEPKQWQNLAKLKNLDLPKD